MKKIMISIIACFMMLVMCAGLATPALAEGVAPVAENLELKTYRNVSVSGMLSAYDPEGDVVSYEITTEPVKGSIKLEQNGSFVYTPNEGKKGRDYFGYKAMDSQGNLSQEATVIIRIEKQKKSVDYSDMENRGGEYAAVTLSEAGIFTGEQIGGLYCFGPDKTVSRGEFLSMCMLVSQEPIVKGVYSTGYSDDAAMPYWLKEYVATATMQGIGEGDREENSFDAEAPISKSEALKMLNDALGLNNIDYVQMNVEAEDDTIQACMNLSAVGILREQPVMEEELNREAAALLLVEALEIMENR